MKIAFVASLSLLAAVGTASPALAGGGGGEYQVTVDYIPFTIGGTRGEQARTITFDVRSVEAVEDGDWFGVDLNDDGEIAYIDSHIFVFAAAPTRGKMLGTLMGENDDDFTNGFGTLYGYDSFLQLDLLPGDYVLAISTFHMSEEEARSGVNFTGGGPFTLATNPAEEWSNFDHGDYSIRASDNFRGATVFETEGTIFVVPAPAAAMVLGLAGMMVGRRRR
jgi:hypothetical protein